MAGDCCVFNSPAHRGRKALMRFLNENSVFEFLRLSVDVAKETPQAYHSSNNIPWKIRQINLKTDLELLSEREIKQTDYWFQTNYSD